MPIRDRDDATQVAGRFQRFFEAGSEQRPGILRELFTEILDFDRESSQLSLVQAQGRAGIELPDVAERIATLDGVEVLYVDLSATDTTTDRIRKAEVLAAASVVRDALREDMLLLFSNRSGDQLHWIHPKFSGGLTPTLRRIVLERDIEQRTAVQQLSNIYWNYSDSGNILDAVNEAFNVDKVTKDFFREYKRIFEQAEELIAGFADDEERKQFVQTLFNRLMFVYFLSRKGWLGFNGDTDYLNALWRDYESDGSQTNFYDSRLYWLFFFGLNNSEGRDFNNHFEDRFMASQIGKVPFLNGGLFEETELDERDGITVADEAIRPLMTELFDKFNFTVMESTPFDIEVAVDPEMLGKVFEELVTGRHDSGAYYTPRPVVSFMCREALKGYLEAHQPDLDSDAVTRFVDDHDASGISISQATAIQRALEAVTVVDPACGSGAYLVGMMQELVDLRVELYNQKLRQDARSLYELKLHIIESNLHGVDLDPFAVNIAMLRLWLSLAIEFEGDQPEPLPNLDFKIVEGDSLLGPDPSETGQQGVLGYDGNAVDELRVLKSHYMTESDPNRKTQLRESITEAEATIRERLSHFAGTDNALDWRIDFAEVIADGGFDIAVANPPYIQLEKDGGRLRKLYASCGYESHVARGDIYQLFYERGCQLLQSTGGLLAYITSNSWMRSRYGRTTRSYFSRNHTPLRWLDLGKDVFESAIVDSGVLLLRTGGEATPFPSVDMDAVLATDVPPADEQWGETRPNDDAAWSVLSHIEWSVMEKMLARGTPLKEWDVKINYGIKTGYNEAFLVDTATRNALIEDDPKSAEIIKPVLRGRDVRRYRAEWAGNWVIIAKFGSHKTLPRDHPALYEHLSKHETKLKARGQCQYSRGSATKQGVDYPGQHHWLELDNNPGDDYLSAFTDEKLFWIELVEQGRFAYSNSEMYCVNSAYMLTGSSVKYLCGVLNSVLTTWFVRSMALNSGMGTPRWIRSTVDQILVPKASSELEAPVVQLVDRILNANTTDSDAEQEIDRLVYDLYGLTDEEIAAVEARVSSAT